MGNSGSRGRVTDQLHYFRTVVVNSSSPVGQICGVGPVCWPDLETAAASPGPPSIWPQRLPVGQIAWLLITDLAHGAPHKSRHLVVKLIGGRGVLIAAAR